MDSSKFLSNEEMNIRSAFMTQKSLYELGKTHAMVTYEEENIENQKQLLKNNILDFKMKFVLGILKKKQAYSFECVDIKYYECEKVNEYVELVNLYIGTFDKDMQKKDIEIKKLKEENTELREEKLESDKEYSELEEKYEKLNKYWEHRVKKLREKCINKNLVINRLNYSIIFLIFNFAVIKYYGFYNYINVIYFTFYYSIYYPIYPIYYSIYYLYYFTILAINFVHYLLNIITNFVLYLLLFDFVKVFLVYIVAILCCISIMKPLY